MAQGEVGQSGGSQETSYLDLWARGGFGAAKSRESRIIRFPPEFLFTAINPGFSANAGGNP